MVLAERFAAAAGAAGVGVAHLEALAVQAIVEVHGGAVEVGVAGRVDKELHALALELEVAVLAHVEGHAVLEARAPARLDEHAQERGRVGLLGVQGADLAGRFGGEVDHAFKFSPKRRESRGGSGSGRLALPGRVG